MCHECDDETKHLPPEQQARLKTIQEQMEALASEVRQVRGDPAPDDMKQRYETICKRFDVALIEFCKGLDKDGLLGPNRRDYAALLVPALMLFACRLAVHGGFGVSDAAQAFGHAFENAMMARGMEMAERMKQAVDLMKQPGGGPH